MRIRFSVACALMLVPFLAAFDESGLNKQTSYSPYGVSWCTSTAMKAAAETTPMATETETETAVPAAGTTATFFTPTATADAAHPLSNKRMRDEADLGESSLQELRPTKLPPKVSPSYEVHPVLVERAHEKALALGATEANADYATLPLILSVPATLLFFGADTTSYSAETCPLLARAMYFTAMMVQIWLDEAVYVLENHHYVAYSGMMRSYVDKCISSFKANMNELAIGPNLASPPMSVKEAIEIWARLLNMVQHDMSRIHGVIRSLDNSDTVGTLFYLFRLDWAPIFDIRVVDKASATTEVKISTPAGFKMV